VAFLASSCSAVCLAWSCAVRLRPRIWPFKAFCLVYGYLVDFGVKMALLAFCAVIRLFLACGPFLACVVVPGAVPGFVRAVRSGCRPRIWLFKAFKARSGTSMRASAKNPYTWLFGALFGRLRSAVLFCSAGFVFRFGPGLVGRSDRQRVRISSAVWLRWPLQAVRLRPGFLIGSAAAPFRRPVLCAIRSAVPCFCPDQSGGPSSWGVSSGSRPALFGILSGVAFLGVCRSSEFWPAAGGGVVPGFWGGVDGGRRFERRMLKNIKYVFTNSVSIPAAGSILARTFLESANARYLEYFWSEF